MIKVCLGGTKWYRNLKAIAISKAMFLGGRPTGDAVHQEKNMFYKINAILQALTNNVFIVLKLSEDFTKTYNAGLLLQMHGHLKKITENNYYIYMDVKNASIIEPYRNNSVFNMTETVRQVLNNGFEILDEDTNKIEAVDSTDSNNFKNTQNASKHTQNGANRLKTIELIKNLLRVIDSIDLNITEPFNGTIKDFFKTRRGTIEKRYDLKKWDPSPAMEDLLHATNNTRRMYHGTNTSIERFPFMASIHVAGVFTCSGSIVAKDLVIAAASCFQVVYNNGKDVKSSVSARVGSLYARRHGTVLPVMAVHFHPEYDSEHLRNNIALARVPRVGRTPGARRIAYERSVHPLPLDTVVGMLGWGDKDDGVSGDMSPLAVTVISLYNIRECKEAYTANYVNDQNFCAGYTTKGDGACSRDLGGPGIIRGVLTGVISFGPPICGTPDAPTVFTRIGHYAGWIDDIAKGEKFASTEEAPEIVPLTLNSQHESNSQQVQRSRKFELPLSMEFLKSVLNKLIFTAANDDEGPMIEINNPGNEFYRLLDALKHKYFKETTKKTLVVNKSTPNLNIQRTGADRDFNPDWVDADDYRVTATVNWDRPDRPHNHKHNKYTIVDGDFTSKTKHLRGTPKFSTIKDPKFLKEIKKIESFIEPKYLSKIRQKLIAAAEVEDPNEEEKHKDDKKETKVRLQYSMDESKETLYNNFETDHDLSDLEDEERFSGQFSLEVDDQSRMHTNNKFDETQLKLGININT